MNKIFSKLLLGTIALTTANASWADLAASTLPVSRSVQVGAVATAFATLINSGNVDATGCRIELGSAITADFFYQATDPATNQTVGAPDTPVNIAAGAAASFIFGITPTMTLATEPMSNSASSATTPVRRRRSPASTRCCCQHRQTRSSTSSALH